MDDYEAYLIEEVLADPVSRSELLRRASVAGVSVTALSALLARSGSAATVAPARQVAVPKIKRGGVGRVGSNPPGALVDAVLVDNPGAVYAVNIACEYLCAPRANYSLEPRLATSWKSNTKADEWTFTIRQGVRFHNGSAMSVDDVVATFNRLTDPATKSAALSVFKGVLSFQQVEKVGRNQVRFNLDRPYSDFPYLVSAFNFPTVILPRNYQIGDFVKGGVGTGPYVLRQYRANELVTYVRNPRYWAKGPPYMNGVELKYGDSQALVLAIQAGEIDALVNPPQRGAEALFRDANIRVLQSRSTSRSDITMRVDTPPFNNKLVRQAIAYALDRKKIVELVQGGYAEIGNDHGFAPVFPVSSAVKLPQRQQDYARARRLLAEAGHERGFATTLTSVQLGALPEFAVVVKEQLRPVGIDVTVDVKTVPAFFGGGSNATYLVMPFGVNPWGARGAPSQLIGAGFRCEALFNTPHWCNRQFNITMDQFDSQPNETVRRRLAQKGAAIQHDKTPAVIAYWSKTLIPQRKKVQGLPSGPQSFLDVLRMWLS